MAIDPAQHTRPARNMDPAQDDRDPDQINPDGTPGSDAELAGDLETTQTGGSRNERVTEFTANRHSTEPAVNSSAQPGYGQASNTGSAEGASTHTLADELAEQAKLKDPTASAAAADQDQLVFSSESPAAEQRGKLPTGMAEKIETVEIAGMRRVK